MRILAAAAVLTMLALTGSAQADDAVVPILTGGEVHWVGSASRSYNVSSSDSSGSQSQDSGHSNIAWDTHFLLSGYYSDAPRFGRPEGVVFPTSYTKALGSGASHHYELDCNSPGDCVGSSTQDCTWTETANGPGAGALDPPVDRHYIVVAFGQDTHGTNYSCQRYAGDNPSLWHDCENGSPWYAAGVCATEIKFPAKPLEGDNAKLTQQFNHATGNVSCSSGGDWPCTQTGHSTLTLSCALCVTAIQFEQPDLPSRSLVNVGSDGTFDGNRVRVTATIHNSTQRAITAPVRFRDFTVDRDLTPAAGGEKPADQITFPAGQDTTVVLDWNTEGFAWYLPHKPDPHQIAVLTPYGGARRDLSVRPKPVLLVHGYNANASTWDGYPDLFTGVRKDWLARAVTGMDTNPWFGNTLAQNARILARSIEELRDEYDAEHVDLVVHSMGGLISRQYLQSDAPNDPDHRPVVAHLVMLGTPNEGSDCAYVSSRLAPGAPSLQLMPVYLAYFNRVVTNTRGTKLSVLAGIAPRWEQVATTAICGLPEPNDLVVWKKSAFWTLSDTATQIGLVHTDMTHDTDAFHNFVVPHLAVTPEGPAVGVARDSGIRAGGAAASASPSPAADIIPGLALASTVKVPGRGSTRTPLRLSGGSGLDVLSVAPAGVRIQLENSAGKVVATTTSAGEMSALSASGPLHGTWNIVATNPTLSKVPVSLAARIIRDPFKVVPTLKAEGRQLVLTVSVSGGGHTRASAVESAARGQSAPHRVRLRSTRGKFSATLKPMPGGTIVTITVRGPNGTRTAVAVS